MRKLLSKWLISVPVWGAPYVRVFSEAAAPALLAAVSRMGAPVKFVVHTDSPDAVRAALAGQEVDLRPVPSKPTYVTLQEAHADAVLSAAPGDRVVLLNADLVVSGNLLARCAEHFAAGKEAVVLLGIRTILNEAARPPVDAAPRALLAWAWANRHQIIRDLEWGSGGSMLPTNLFFAEGGSVVARGFHLHPVAVVRQDSVQFKSTIDGDLLDGYLHERVHVVVDPDDCAMVEMSDPARRFPVRAAQLSAPGVAASMRARASATHRWLFTHRIGVLEGAAAMTADLQPCEAILRLLSGPAERAPPSRESPIRRGRVPARPRSPPPPAASITPTPPPPVQASPPTPLPASQIAVAELRAPVILTVPAPAVVEHPITNKRGVIPAGRRGTQCSPGA